MKADVRSDRGGVRGGTGGLARDELECARRDAVGRGDRGDVAAKALRTSSPSEFIARKHAERLATIAAAAPSKVGLFRRVYDGKAAPRAAIKAHCLECLGFSEASVRDCTSPACPLYTFRPYQGGRL